LQLNVNIHLLISLTQKQIQCSSKWTKLWNANRVVF